MRKEHPDMPVKRALERQKSRRVLGHPGKPPKTALRAGLYARCLGQRSTDLADAESCSARLRRAARLDHRQADEGSRLRCHVATDEGATDRSGAAPGDRRGTCLAPGPLGKIGDRPARHFEGVGASRRRLCVAHRGSRSDHACRPRHGRTAGCLR